jgi:hypothetical protein
MLLAAGTKGHECCCGSTPAEPANASLLLHRKYRGHGVAIFAEVQQHLPLLQSGSTCGGIHSEKRKGRKSQFLYTAHLRKTNLAEIFSEARSERSLTKTKKELQD